MKVPNFSLQGKTALITGATQGLGFEIAQAFAAGGAHVIINGRHPERVAQAVQHIVDSGGKADPWVQDIGQLEALEDAFAQLSSQVGPIDVLVNNVGMRMRQSLAESSLQDIQWLLQVDLIAATLLSRLVAQEMAAKHLPGRIISMTSVADRVARRGDAIYPIAKHGLAGLVKALAVEYGPKGITSNGIAPGTFATQSNLYIAQDPVMGPKILGRNPLERWGDPAEIAGAAVFLASPAASYVNGHTLVVDGGFSIAF